MLGWRPCLSPSASWPWALRGSPSWPAPAARTPRPSRGPTTAKPPDPSAEQKAFLDDLAKRLNVTRDKLDEAFKGAASDRVDAAVAAGRLTKEQGDEIKQRIQSATALPPLGLGPGMHMRGGGPGGPGR